MKCSSSNKCGKHQTSQRFPAPEADHGHTKSYLNGESLWTLRSPEHRRRIGTWPIWLSRTNSSLYEFGSEHPRRRRLPLGSDGVQEDIFEKPDMGTPMGRWNGLAEEKAKSIVTDIPFQFENERHQFEKWVIELSFKLFDGWRPSYLRWYFPFKWWYLINATNPDRHLRSI